MNCQDCGNEIELIKSQEKGLLIGICACAQRGLKIVRIDR